MEMHRNLYQASIVALRDCLRLQKNESILILTDPVCHLIGRSLLAAARDMDAFAVYTEIPLLERSGAEPPPPIVQLMKGFNVVVAPTERSLTHTEARRAACRSGARVATMPGIRRDLMIRCLSADYYAIAQRTQKVTEILTLANQLHVSAPSGTDIHFSVSGISAIASTGLIHEPGSFGNLPSGEAYLRPLEGTANGVVVVDGSMAGVGNLMETGETIRIEIKEGMATHISGGPGAVRLQQQLQTVGPGAFTVGEFGIGTNHAAQITGNLLEDEKVMGTIHFAFGNNISMGGSCDVPIHLDGIIRNPTVELDGKLIMENGDLFIG